MASLWKDKNTARARSVYRSSASAFAVTASFAVLMGASPAMAQGRASGNQGLADIIVTAQKREQNLQDVPVAVTAIGEKQIEEMQVQSFQDIDALAPSLTIDEGAGGAYVAISMRGISGSTQVSGVDSGVAIYVDGIYMSRKTGAGFDQADIERIEVLRGPQGTLFGRNSTAGAINYVSSAPKGQFYVRQELGIGNNDRRRAKTRIDLPAFGPFTISASYLHDEEEGTTRNSDAGRQWDFSAATAGKLRGIRTSPRTLGDKNNEAGRVAVRFAPEGGPITADYRFDFTDSRYTPIAYQTIGFPSAGGAATYAAQPPGHGVVSKDQLDAVPNGFTTPGRLKAFGHSLTIAYDLSDAFQLKSITGYRGTTDTHTSTLSGDSSLVVGVPETTFIFLGFANYERFRGFSQEVQLSYTSDLIDGIAGVYYYKERVLSVTPAWLFQTITSPLPGRGEPGGPNNYGENDAHNKSYAAFAQATLHATDRFDITGGIRYTRDKRFTESNSLQFGIPVPNFPSQKFNFVDWTANVAYRPTDDLNLYARAATAHLSGGLFNGAIFEPEKVLQFEVGAKADLFDGRLRTNIAAYTTQYTKRQGAFVCSAAPCTGLFIQGNIDDRRINGIEAELTASVTPEVTLRASGGLTGNKLVKIRNLAAGLNPNDIGDFVWTKTVALFADYKREIGNGMELSFNFNARYRDRLNQDNSADPNVAEAYAHTAYWDLGARAALGNISMFGTKAQLAVWGRNLLNKEKPNSAQNVGLVVAANYTRPRSYGLDLTFELNP